MSSKSAEVLRPYKRSRVASGPAAARRKSFTRRFFCLAARRQDEAPAAADRCELGNAGLGERKVTFPDKFCTAAEFSRTLFDHFPSLKHCGGYQLLRSRGSSRSKTLVLIDCPSDGYTPLYLCRSANIGQAVIYVRPLQRDIDLKKLTQRQQAGPQAVYMVACMYCGQNFSINDIQDHVDACEVVLHPSEEVCPSASSSLSAAGRPSSELSSEDWKTEPDLQAAVKMFRTFILQKAQDKPNLQVTLDLHGSEAERERDMLCFYKQADIDWTRPFEVQLKGDSAMGQGVKRHFFSLLLDKIHTGLHLDFDSCGGKTLFFIGEVDHQVPSTSRTLLDSNLFRVVGRVISHSFIHGGPLLTGLSRCFFPLLSGSKDTVPALELQDCPDIDVVDIVSLLESRAALTAAETERVDTLAISWDLPALTATNRRWLAEKILHHAVIGRRERQIAQMRRGLKDAGVLQLLKERPEAAAVLFPRCAELELEPQMILHRISWPESDSDDEDDVEEFCDAASFLRKFIESASSLQLGQLVQFWTGWTILPDRMFVEIQRDLMFPVASTCSATLKVPAGCGTFSDFTDRMTAAVQSTQFGFGRI